MPAEPPGHNKKDQEIDRHHCFIHFLRLEEAGFKGESFISYILLI